jgi:hypothetical protein
MNRSTITVLVLASVTAIDCASAQKDEIAPTPTDQPPSMGPPGPQPDFGPLVRADHPPPPISGGTLAVAPDGHTVVAADPDRDRVYVLDIPTRTVAFNVQLETFSEPGRVAIDDTGHAWVILRHKGGVAVIDLATGKFTTRDVCSTPRGIAFDDVAHAMHVACADGQLYTLPVDGSAPTKIDLPIDLRDVVILGDSVVRVSRFREAEIVRFNGGTMTDRIEGANLAWRTIAVPGSDSTSKAVAMVSQQPTPGQVSPQPGGYGGISPGNPNPECAPKGIVTTRVTLVDQGSVQLPEAVLPVDLASNGREFVVVAAGNAFTKELPQLFVLFRDAIGNQDQGCVPAVHGNVPGQAIAAVFDGDDNLLVQTREPAALHIMTEDRRRPWKSITLATDPRADTGHSIFHSNAGGFIACASCHAEGTEDGRVWEFVGMGPRRTPSLLGTIQDTQPYHWDGEMKDLRDLVDHVFVERMSGPHIDDDHLDVLKNWIFALPPPPAIRPRTDASERGAVLFGERCTMCHAGSRLTNNQTVDVGTGGGFQVPSLIGVGWRAPYLHNGCAKTLQDRFNPACGGTGHATTSDLSPAQIDDLIAFLQTL